MSFRLFNRYEVFDTNAIRAYKDLVNDIDIYIDENPISNGNSFMNMLYGVWDGYLYDDIIPTMETIGLPEEYEIGVRDFVNFIEKYVE